MTVMTEKRCASGLSLLAVGAVLWPVLQNWRSAPRDSFPLSYYPMFSARRPRRVKVLHVVGLDAQGRRHSIPYRYYGSGGLNQVRRQLRHILRAGRGEALCREVAARLARRPEGPLGGVVTVQIVAGRFALDGFYRGDLTAHRERVRAIWPSAAAPEAFEVAK